MHVLFVNQYFPPDVSATAYLLGDLAEGLARHHAVSVLAGQPSYNPEAGRYEPEGVTVRRTPSTSFARSSMVGRLTNYGTYVAGSFVQGLGMPRPDVVVAMTDPPVAGALGAFLARRYRAPFVWILEDIFPDVAVALGKLRQPAVVEIWTRLNQRLRRTADRLVAIGRDMVEKLEGEGVPPSKITLIPNWASDVTIDPGAVDALRRERGWADRFIVMHAGNLGLAQDLHTTVRAAMKMRDVADARFVFVGDGAARIDLQREARRLDLPNVEFLPYVPKERAQKLLSAADLHLVTLAPGLWGCVTPSKLYGILASGRPYVAAVDHGSEPARVAQEHDCGIWVPPGDPGALADAISEARRSDLSAMGFNGRTAFEERYERRHAIAAYRSLLEEVTSA